MSVLEPVPMSAASPGRSAEPALAIRGLTVEFSTYRGAVRVLSDVSVCVESGEIVALVGESGSGKSVTALACVGLLPPAARITGGTIDIVGRSPLRQSERALRDLRGKIVSFVFQEPMSALNPTLRIGIQIEQVLRQHERLDRSLATERALQLLEEMNVPDPARVMHCYPFELSGGMRQRVLIAMAFACNPRLLIADEPTTALDVTVQAQVLELLRARAQARGIAVLLITHDLAVVSQFCSRVYVMYAGEIVEGGTTREVLSRPTHSYTRRLLQAASAAPSAAEPHNVTTPTAPSLVAISAVEVRYPIGRSWGGRPAHVVHALNGVDLEIYRGETLAVVGESGCGKSTLAQLVMGLLAPDEGRVRFDGRDLRSLGPEQLRETRHRLQMVFQDPQASLNPRMSAWRIITEPLQIGGRLQVAALRSKAAELAALVRIQAEHLDRYPHEFSGGQRQRLAIARALALSPDLLVLDEPTSALDVSIQEQILELLLDLQRRLALTYLFISHNVAVVRRVATRVAVMYRGQIVELGPAARLLEAPRHPYTIELIAAVPSLSTPMGLARYIGASRGNLAAVESHTVPRPAPERSVPAGCYFQARCPQAGAGCEKPQLLRATEAGRYVRCHRVR